MSKHLAERIYKPEYFGIKPLIRGRGNRETYLIGFDSEAHSCGLLDHRRCKENGYPFLYQFSHAGARYIKPLDDNCDLIDVPMTGRKYETFFTFIEYLHTLCTRKDTEYVCVGFNLQYEYTQLFRDLSDELKESDTFKLGDKDAGLYCETPSGIRFYVKALNVKRFTFDIEWATTKRRVKVIDAMAFLPGSLDAAAKMLGVGRKKDHPPRFERGAVRDDVFVEYAAQDAILTRRIGEWIIEQHQEYDVSMTISAPHFSSKVFKRKFLDAEIPLPTPEQEQDGLRAYHGGKNGYYRSKPCALQGVYHVDIRSAYPEAMRQLPNLTASEWSFADRYIAGKHAIWRVRGRYQRCRYRSLMLDGEWARSGVVDLTCTGYELDSAISHNEFSIIKCSGWVLDGPPGGSLAGYVDTFYAQKRYAKSDSQRAAAKLQLNSLYGKFFQKTPQGNVGAMDLDTGEMIMTDESLDHDYVAGGLYHPPIAALITGFVRAKIHGLEHKYDAIMTSTDGFFSTRPPDASLLGKELGMLSSERGTLKILRERVYVFDPDEPEHNDDCPDACDDKHPIYAMHAFMGGLAGLRRMPLTPGNVYHYEAQRMVTLRMSLRSIDGHRYAPGEFVIEPRKITNPGKTLDKGPPIG